MASYRTVRPDDASAVFRVLTQVAPEIPLLLDKPERRRPIRELVGQCCGGKTSWVALNDNVKIIGFLLGRPSRWHVAIVDNEPSGVELLYGGMQKTHRDQGQFSGLLVRAKALGKPLYAVVKHSNKSDMAARLLRTGFVKQGASTFSDEDAFIWTPSAR